MWPCPFRLAIQVETCLLLSREQAAVALFSFPQTLDSQRPASTPAHSLSADSVSLDLLQQMQAAEKKMSASNGESASDQGGISSSKKEAIIKKMKVRSHAPLFLFLSLPLSPATQQRAPTVKRCPILCLDYVCVRDVDSMMVF